MKDKKDPSLGRFLKSHSRGSEGSLFRWLWVNHDAVLSGIELHATGWAPIIERIEAAGVTGKLGGRPTSSAVVKAWARVRREKLVQARVSAEAVSKRRPPNRSPAVSSARPSVPSEPGRSTAASAKIGNAPFAPPSSTHAGSDRRTPTAAEMIENVKRQLAGKWVPEKPGGS